MAFAALDNGLAMVLSRQTPEAFQEKSFLSLRQKLKEIDQLQRSESRPQIPTKRIRELAETRNDLMHGIAFSFLAGKKNEHITVWNPYHNRVKSVSADGIDKLAGEVQGIVFGLGFVRSPKPN